jgi:hypothetical protein
MSAPGKLVRSSRWKSGPSKGQRPLGSECCVATGDSGREAYTAIAWGVGLSREGSDIAGAESFHSLEGNMCGTAMTAVKPANKAKEAHCGGICGGGRSGVGGAKGGGQGEYAPAKHVLGSEPGSRDKGAGAYTATLPSHTRGGRSYGAGGGGCGTFIVHTN